jgi:membrane protease YdiL (CAAX protease family)
VLWKKTWRPEIVMTLAGGIVAVFCVGNLVVEVLRRAGVAGFHSLDSTGSVLLATLSFHGAAILAGILFLNFHGISWREVSGLNTMHWWKQIQLVVVALAVALPVMFSLKIASVFVLEKFGCKIEDQRAVELILAAKSTGLKIYLGIFAVVIAPVAEEFIFRGLLFSACKKAGWPKCGWIVVSVLFAAIHASAPIFLPLFAFALALTWLCEKTEGLLAPVLAHGIFNAANLTLLVVAEKFHLLK